MSNVNAQCGIIFHYSYLGGPCSTNLLNVNLFLSGSTATPFTVLWENNLTGMSNMLDTGYHYVCVFDNVGCMQCDTFPINCVDWTGTTGLQEIIFPLEVSVSPNPANGNFKVSFGHPIHNGNVLLRNALNQVVYESVLHDESDKELSLPDLSAGLYFLEVADERNHQCRKLVIR
jgi:hypothetical protein